MKRFNLIGKKYGRLTVIDWGVIIKKHRYLQCKCDCGNTLIVDSGNLKSGHTQSCGCYQKERASASHKVHGMSHIRFYIIWCAIKNRCNNPNYPESKYYGERGIKVCKRWHKFENFRDDMYQSYQQHVSEYGEKQTTIDRIDSNGNYEPFNCRWATCKEQKTNQRQRKNKSN